MLTVKIQYSGDSNHPGNCPTGCCLSLYQVSNSPKTPPSVPHMNPSTRGFTIRFCRRRSLVNRTFCLLHRADPPRCWVFTAVVMIILVLW